MAKPIVLDQEHMEHIAMLLSYSKDIPDEYGRAMFKEIARLRAELEDERMAFKNLAEVEIAEELDCQRFRAALEEIENLGLLYDYRNRVRMICRKALNNNRKENMMIIEAIIQEANKTANEKGWWDDIHKSVGESIALMHSELSEALEEWRNNGNMQRIYYSGAPGEPQKPEGFTVELADTIIRICDFCGQYNLPLSRALDEKMVFNKLRPYRHGGKLA